MNLLSILISVLMISVSSKKQHTDSKTLDLNLAKYDKVHIYNTGGEINIKTSSNNVSKANIQRVLKASSSRKLEKAKNEVFIDTMSVDGELLIYVNSPYQELETDQYDDHMRYVNKNERHNSYLDFKKIGVQYEFNIDMSIPSSTNLVVSTHRGDIDVNGVKGQLIAMNHHNSIFLSDVQNLKIAHSHHGDLKINYDAQPGENAEFDTHHGDITVSFPETPSVNLSMDTYHGSFFTDFDWKRGPIKLEKTSKRNKTTYKIGNKTNVTMGSGERSLSFHSHHGSMYILKK